VALRALVLRETGLSVSIGVASSKLVAKMATETAKDTVEHIWVVQPGAEAAYLAPQPVRALIGVGPRTAERLGELDIGTIGELAALELGRLVEVFGRSHGQALFEHSRGIDDSALHPEREARSYSAEHTFQQDTADRRALWKELCDQAEELEQRLREEGLRAGEVAIKLRYADFTTLTRQSRLAAPSDRAEVLAERAAALMRRHWERGRPIRLIGLRAARLEPSGRPIQLVMETRNPRPG
ncbi:MAG: DNA polymerase IV, partial [Chloroflexi bacterium]|nr:DNA polymerase IV [Chloroflexota bacterium]